MSPERLREFSTMKFAAMLLPANKVKGPSGNCLLEAVATGAVARANMKVVIRRNMKRMIWLSSEDLDFRSIQ